MKPLSIQILTTHTNANTQQSILQTWLLNFSEYCFYTDFTTGIGNQLELTTNCAVDSGGEKHILNLQRIHREKLWAEYDWFLFCDDDTVPNIKLILDFIKTADKNTVYGWWDHVYNDDKTLKSFSGGAGYLVSGQTLGKFPPPNLKSIIWSDVQFSIWVRENGISIATVPENATHSTTKFKWDMPHNHGIDINTESGREEIRSTMTFHYVKDPILRQIITAVYEQE